MYTMKIVLFNILLICVISENFATWSTRSLAKRIGTMKEKLSEEEAKQDILSLLNIDNEDGSKSVSLQNFPLKKLLKADFSRAPMFDNAKPQETLEVVPLDNQQNLFSELGGKYPKQFLTPSQLDDDSASDDIIPNKNLYPDSETDEMLFVVRLPPNYSYIKEQPPIVDGLSVEDMTVLEIPPGSSKEPKNYYFKPNKKPFNFYQNVINYKPKRPKFNKKLMQLLKRLMFQSKIKREMNRSKNPYRVGDNVMGRFTNIIKHNSVTYYDKLKEYLQELVAKLLNKAMKQREDQEKVRRSNYRRRIKRDTQAGYTQDPDTCKKYNENLEKMWDTLSKYLNSTDPVNQQALHNIAVMVEAYIDHQNERPHLEDVDYHQEKKKDKISEVLTKIRKLLGDENATEKVKEMVLENFKPDYDDNTECKQTNEDNLISSIDLSYKNYLDNSKCRGDYDTGLLRGKALLRNGAPIKPRDMSDRQFYDTYILHNNILDEAEASEEFHKGRLPANQRYKKRGRFNRWNDRRSFGSSAKLSRFARQSRKRHTGLRRRPKKSSKKRPKKTHIRSDESCVKYANRKFLITLRTSIERFMDLRDCHQDDTLRTSNKNRKATNRRRKQALRTSNKRKFNDMTFYTDSELGEKERRRINNYLSNIQDFNEQEINRNKSIFIVHTTSYKSPLLLKLNNKREGMHTSNMKQQLEGPSYYKKTSKYGFDTIYKSFLESSDKDSFDTLHSKKALIGDLQSKHKEGGIRNINLYDIIKQKVDQEKNKRPFIVGRQNGENNEQLDVEPIQSNNATDEVSPINLNITNLAQNGTSINFEEIGNMLEEVRNSTLQKPQIDASNFVSNNDKGYVELSYLVKYPKSIVFRPQYLVKNILQYQDFVKVASQLYVTDEDKQLMKIVRYLPDNKTQVLFETQDFKSPIEVFDVKEDIKKTQPIFPANFSDSNEALRQRVTNEIDVHNFESENKSQISILPEDRTNEIRLLRENEDLNFLPNDNVSSGLILADDFTEETINSDISNIEPLRDDNIDTDVTRAEKVLEDEVQTDLTNENSLRESSSSTDVSHLFRDDVITNDNDREETEDLIKSDNNNVNLLSDSIDKVDHIHEDRIADLLETLPEETNDTLMSSTDALRESSINAHISKTDILRNDNITIDNEQIDHIPDDITNSELIGTDSLREIKISTDTNNADALQEDEEKTNSDLLQETKINYDGDQVDHLRENNISAVMNRADIIQESKITTEDSKEYLQPEDKMSTGVNEIDLLRQKKISADAYHVDMLQENTKLNKDDSINNNEHNLEEGNFNMDFSRIDSLQEEKNITDDNLTDSVLENNTEEYIADSLRESHIDIDVDRSYLVSKNNISVDDSDSTDLLLEDNTEGNDLYSLRENAISTEVNRESSQLENKNYPEIANVSLRDDKAITEVSQDDLLRENKNSTESNEDPSNETKIGMNLNSLYNLYNSKKEYSTPENNINADVDRVNIQREDISSNLPRSLLKESEDTHSLRDSKISTDSNEADSMQEHAISTHIVELLPDDITSTEENMTDSLQQIKINHDIDFTDLLRKHNNDTETNRLDRLREYKSDEEVNNTDYLRDNETILIRGQEDTIKGEINREDQLPEEKTDSVDSLRAIEISSSIKHEDYLPKYSIFTDNNNDDSAPEHEIQTNIDHIDSLRENQVSPNIKHENSVQNDSIINKNNSINQDEIHTQTDNGNFLREHSLLKDNIISENNNDDPVPEIEIQTKIDYIDSLHENKIDPENTLQENNFSTGNNNRDALAEDINNSKLDNEDTVRESITSREVEEKHDFNKDNLSFEIKQDYPLTEHKITELDNVDSLQERTIITEANNDYLLREDKVSTESNRDHSLVENGHSNEFTYSNENLPLGGTGQLRNSKITAVVDAVDNFEDKNMNFDVSRIDLRDKISSEDLLEEGKMILEEILTQKLVDPLRELEINPELHRDNPSLEDKNSDDFNSNEYKQFEDKYSNVDPLQNGQINADFEDSVRGNNMNQEVSSVEGPKNEINTEVNKENINNIDNSPDLLPERDMSNEFNRAEQLPVEANAEAKQIDSLADKISYEIDQGDTLREGTSSTVVNRAELSPDETTNTDVSHNIASLTDTETDIVSDLITSNSLRDNYISTDGNRSDTLPKNITTLRVDDVSTHDNRKDFLTVDKIETDTSNENVMHDDKLSSVIYKSDPLPEDIPKKILRDDEIKFSSITEYSLPEERIDVTERTDIDASYSQLDGKEQTSTELNIENTLPVNKIRAEISPVTALRDNGSFENRDHSEGEEVSTDDYRVNPLLKHTISHEIGNTDLSHSDILSDDNINKDITRGDTLLGKEKSEETERADPLLEDSISIDNTKGSLRENNIDSNVKLTGDLPGSETYTGLNRDSLQDDKINNSVTRSGLPEDNIEKDDLNLDARKEPRNYTEELDYLTYQDGSIAVGLNISSNEFERVGNAEEPPNPVLNETLYKYNASSALREQVIDTFNDTLNSSEFINRKDDLNLNELNKNISLPDIDAESIADYLRFTLNNAEASLSSASQAYLKELETQGLTNAAATKMLLKNWWDAWKNKLTAKVQSIAGRVTNLYKKLDKTSPSNEEPEIKEESGDV